MTLAEPSRLRSRVEHEYSSKRAKSRRPPRYSPARQTRPERARARALGVAASLRANGGSSGTGTRAVRGAPGPGEEQVDGAWSETNRFQNFGGTLALSPVTRCADGVGSTRASRHERHEVGGHGDEGAHHVAVFVFEDVAVVHVPAGVGGEADGDFEDLGAAIWELTAGEGVDIAFDGTGKTLFDVSVSVLRFTASSPPTASPEGAFPRSIWAANPPACILSATAAQFPPSRSISDASAPCRSCGGSKTKLWMSSSIAFIPSKTPLRRTVISNLNRRWASSYSSPDARSSQRPGPWAASPLARRPAAVAAGRRGPTMWGNSSTL
jgi:hypothetical protein